MEELQKKQIQEIEKFKKQITQLFCQVKNQKTASTIFTNQLYQLMKIKAPLQQLKSQNKKELEDIKKIFDLKFPKTQIDDKKQKDQKNQTQNQLRNSRQQKIIQGRNQEQVRPKTVDVNIQDQNNLNLYSKQQKKDININRSNNSNKEQNNKQTINKQNQQQTGGEPSGYKKINQQNKPQLQNLQNSTQLKQQKPIILILGCPGVGKTTLMQKLLNQNTINEFHPYNIEQLQYQLVDTVGFNFKDNIDQREEQIKLFQNFFFKYPNQICHLFILVNFERTDMMKAKFKEVYSYFNKFIDKITIVVTQFHLSDQKNDDQTHLKQQFSYFKVKDILFIGDDTKKTELIELFNQVNMNLNEKFIKPCDFKDTIFEDIDAQTQQMVLNLQKQFYQ